MSPFLRSKIVVTLGPASCELLRLKALLNEGVRVFRLNLSHGDLAFHKRIVESLREESAERKIEISIFVDLPGPKVRLGEFKAFEVKEGDSLSFGLKSDVPLPEKAFLKVVEEGDVILLGDGFLRFRVERVERDRAKVRAESSGKLTPRLGVTIVGKSFPLPAFTEKDREILSEVLSWDIDLIALSFVLSGKDVFSLKSFLKERGKELPVIAKVERAEAVENIEGILKTTDVVMVARGDLGLTLPLEEVPMVQKRIIREARREGVPSITATQMLESMLHSPRPTRAEVSDVANAILDGTDCLMLSGETAVGEYPIEAVKTMNKISSMVEREFDYGSALACSRVWAQNEPLDAIAFAACELAYNLEAKAIIVATTTGRTARRVSRFRPPVPVIAVSPSLLTVRSLNLTWGVYPFKVRMCRTTDEMLEEALKASQRSGFVKEGDRVVVTSGVLPGIPGGTNIIKVETV